jgi:hypothetical protein
MTGIVLNTFEELVLYTVAKPLAVFNGEKIF